MSDAETTQIAAAVAARLKTAQAGGEIPALADYQIATAYIPQHQLPDLTTGQVDVIQKSRPSTLQSRTAKRRTHELDVLIRRKTSIENARPVAGLVHAFMRLTEQICELFEGNRLAAYPAALCTGWTNQPTLDPIHLDQYSQLTSLLTLSFTTHA